MSQLPKNHALPVPGDLVRLSWPNGQPNSNEIGLLITVGTYWAKGTGFTVLPRCDIMLLGSATIKRQSLNELTVVAAWR